MYRLWTSPQPRLPDHDDAAEDTTIALYGNEESLESTADIDHCYCITECADRCIDLCKLFHLWYKTPLTLTSYGLLQIHKERSPTSSTCGIYKYLVSPLLNSSRRWLGAYEDRGECRSNTARAN
jgi:hypothetical protein